MIIRNGTVLHRDELQPVTDLRIENGKIAAIHHGLTARAGEDILDASGCYVLPGLIDLHTHGLKHADVSMTTGQYREYAGYQAEEGVTGCVPTVGGRPEMIIETMQAALAETDHFRQTPNLLGFRLEFPYLGKPGAGPKHMLTPINEKTTQALYRAGEGYIRIFDVSPELDGAIPFVDWATNHGIITSLAHTAASIEQARGAVGAGMRLVTHLYDTFDVVAQKEPGLYPAGLTDYVQVEDRLTVEIIPDGVHVDPLLVEKTFRCKGVDRLAFITDSSRGSGLPPGVYPELWGEGTVYVTPDRGRRRQPGDDLSGSVITQLGCFQNAVRSFGKSLLQASIVCARTPARVLGLTQKGYLAAGADADVIVLDEDLRLRLTILAGQVVYTANQTQA